MFNPGQASYSATGASDSWQPGPRPGRVSFTPLQVSWRDVLPITSLHMRFTLLLLSTLRSLYLQTKERKTSQRRKLSSLEGTDSDSIFSLASHEVGSGRRVEEISPHLASSRYERVTQESARYSLPTLILSQVYQHLSSPVSDTPDQSATRG